MKKHLIICLLLLVTSTGNFAAFKPSNLIIINQWFDSYGKISWEEETAHLDNFAYYLKRRPEMVGYIAFYVGKNDQNAETQSRIERVKSYLICDLKVEKSAINIIKVEGKDENKTILQPVSKNDPPPIFN